MDINLEPFVQSNGTNQFIFMALGKVFYLLLETKISQINIYGWEIVTSINMLMRAQSGLVVGLMGDLEFILEKVFIMDIALQCAIPTRMRFCQRNKNLSVQTLKSGGWIDIMRMKLLSNHANIIIYLELKIQIK